MAGRPRTHASTAARQAAYRQRQAEHEADMLSRWHAELGIVWQDVHALLFRVGVPDAELAAIGGVLRRLDNLRDEVRHAKAHRKPAERD